MPDRRPKVTMAEIAKEAGVSKATVSRALSGSTLIGDKVCEHVEQVAEKLGYVVKSRKRHAERSILTIKLVLPPIKHHARQLFYNFVTLAEGLREGLLPSCANLIVENYRDEFLPFPHKKGGQIDAFIFAFHRPTSGVIREVQAQGALCVVLNRIVRGVKRVVSDHADAMRMIAEHLGERGVSGDCHFVSYTGIRDVTGVRLKGFTDGCRKAGIVFDPINDFWEVPSPEAISLERIQSLYDSGVRTFVGINDVIGVVMMQQLRRLNLRIPEDVRVTGCDRAPLHEIIYPRLTTVDLSVHRLALEAGRLLQSEIVQKTKAVNSLIIKGNLLVGDST